MLSNTRLANVGVSNIKIVGNTWRAGTASMRAAVCRTTHPSFLHGRRVIFKHMCTEVAVVVLILNPSFFSLSFASFSPFRWSFSFFRCSLFNLCYLTIDVLLHSNSCNYSSPTSNAQRRLSAESYIIVWWLQHICIFLWFNSISYQYVVFTNNWSDTQRIIICCYL